MTEATIPDLSELTDDGDTTEHAGMTYRLRIEPDPDISIMDEQGEGAWCGRLEWTDGRSEDYGYARRPVGFDGAARIIDRDRSLALWWQPPSDLIDDPDGLTVLRRAVLDLLNFGYVQVGLEECEGTDAYGRLIVRRSAWIGGVDEFYPELVPELFGELA